MSAPRYRIIKRRGHWQVESRASDDLTYTLAIVDSWRAALGLVTMLTSVGLN